MISFLADHTPRRISVTPPAGLKLRGLYLGQGILGLEILVFEAEAEPKLSILRQIWKDRLNTRATPLLAVVLHGAFATVCGPVGEDPPTRCIETKQAEHLCH